MTCFFAGPIVIPMIMQLLVAIGIPLAVVQTPLYAGLLATAVGMVATALLWSTGVGIFAGLKKLFSPATGPDNADAKSDNTALIADKAQDAEQSAQKGRSLGKIFLIGLGVSLLVGGTIAALVFVGPIVLPMMMTSIIALGLGISFSGPLAAAGAMIGAGAAFSVVGAGTGLAVLAGLERCIAPSSPEAEDDDDLVTTVHSGTSPEQNPSRHQRPSTEGHQQRPPHHSNPLAAASSTEQLDAASSVLPSVSPF